LASLYLDTNIFIYALEAESDLGQRAREVLQRVERGAVTAFTSELALAELLRGGGALVDPAIFDAYVALFTDPPELQVVSISRDILMGAAQLQVPRKIDLTGAIHVADRRFRRL
jgi:predicted nucleic acid-binding protein